MKDGATRKEASELQESFLARQLPIASYRKRTRDETECLVTTRSEKQSDPQTLEVGVASKITFGVQSGPLTKRSVVASASTPMPAPFSE